MEFRIFIEILMIVIILSLGFLLLASVTPMLRSINQPEAAPLVEVVYSYSYYNNVTTSYNWTGYLYVYDREPVIINDISLYSNVTLTILSIRINGESYAKGESYILLRGLNNITITFSSPSNVAEVVYVIAFQQGYSLTGTTQVT